MHFGARRWDGVNRKIDAQMKELERHFCVGEIDVFQNKRSIVKKILELLPIIRGNKYKVDLAIKEMDNPDFVYIRASLATEQFISFLKELRQEFPRCKIIVEIPTYPYDKMIQKIHILNDRIYRKRYKEYVDRIATYSCDKEIFGVQTINIRNGIDLESVKPVAGKIDSSCINLIAVATMQKAHGYERCIRGLVKYYENNPERKIVINLVGTGDELGFYEKVAYEHNMTNYVIFHGRKVGAELERLYDKMDIALGAFGCYKIKVNESSGLKIREYLAKGLPIMSGCEEDVFKNNKVYFFKKFPNDSSDIDFDIVVDFYKQVYENEKKREEVHNEIREFAYQTIDISIAMNPIVEYILNCDRR